MLDQSQPSPQGEAKSDDEKFSGLLWDDPEAAAELSRPSVEEVNADRDRRRREDRQAELRAGTAPDRPVSTREEQTGRYDTDTHTDEAISVAKLDMEKGAEDHAYDTARAAAEAAGEERLTTTGAISAGRAAEVGAKLPLSQRLRMLKAAAESGQIKRANADHEAAEAAAAAAIDQGDEIQPVPGAANSVNEARARLDEIQSKAGESDESAAS